jgi:hypothetical protein
VNHSRPDLVLWTRLTFVNFLVFTLFAGEAFAIVAAVF